MMGEGVKRFRAPLPMLISVLLTAVVFGGQTQQQSSSPQQTSQPLPANQQPKNDATKPQQQKKPDAQTPNPDKQVEIGVDVVNVPVTVTDPYGRFVTGLDSGNFEVYED